MPLPFLRTARLVLRPLGRDDWDALAELNADAEVRAYFPGLLSREASFDFAARIERHYDEHGYGLFAVEVVGGDSFVGLCGLAVPNFDAPFLPAVEIGWRFLRSAWGHGYATEAARASLAFGFEALGLRQIVSFTVSENRRSRAVMDRVGMRHEPEHDFDHPNLPEGHPLRRHVFYRIDAGPRAKTR
jgi:RimJ/RimL family protein N-acetyltransferase